MKNAFGHDTRLAFKIGMDGDAKFERTAPSISGISESATGGAQAEGTASVRAPSLTPGSRATIRVSVQHAFSVTYHYVLAAAPTR